jgi:ubiquinone/menaquinone biosynthesis C-methylase UbiE
MIGDVHDQVADRLAKIAVGHILDLGGGNGTLARSLIKFGRTAVVVDRADYVRSAPRPAGQADATRLPFRDGSFAAVAALPDLSSLEPSLNGLIKCARAPRQTLDRQLRPMMLEVPRSRPKTRAPDL